MSQSEKSQSSMLQVDVFDFRHVTLFQNESSLNATGIENRGKISHFLTPTAKFRRGTNEMSE